MAISINNTTITRVQYQGAYYRTVVRNGTTVFNLSNWTYIGTSGSNSFSTSYDYGCCFNSPSQVPVGQLASYLNSAFPVAQYGATVILVQVFAQTSFGGQFFVRNEFYRINQTA
jgi:hypothetical protein